MEGEQGLGTKVARDLSGMGKLLEIMADTRFDVGLRGIALLL